MCLRAPGVKTGTGKWSENPEKMLRECGVELVSHPGGVAIPASTCSCSHAGETGIFSCIKANESFYAYVISFFFRHLSETCCRC